MLADRLQQFVPAERRKHSDILHLLDFFGGKITPTEECLLLGFRQGHGSKETNPPVSSQKPLYFSGRLLRNNIFAVILKRLYFN
jgi:hypothetical protein